MSSPTLTERYAAAEALPPHPHLLLPLSLSLPLSLPLLLPLLLLLLAPPQMPLGELLLPLVTPRGRRRGGRCYSPCQ